MAGEYLPPVVAELLGDSDSAIRQIALVKVSLEDLADTPTTVTIDADITPFEAGLAQAEAEAAAATAKPITFTTTVTPPSLADIAAARAAGGFATTTGGGGMFGGLAGVAAASALSGGGGGGGGVLPAALAGAAAGGGGGGGTSLLAALGFGGGAFGMAGLGSIASLAGFGFEHVLTTGLGLAGSAAGGLLGGGLLGAGWAGTAAVGAGSDAAAMKDAAVEVQQYSSALDRLNRAIAIWGANSTQAKAAQYDLNQVTNTFTPALLQAVIATNNAKNATAQLWDTTAAGARATADTIFQQGLQLADTFIPLIGQAAQQNLGIISEGLKPLFAWLEGPAGIGIFEHLEAVFAKNLPTAVDAFDQAVMLVLRTVDVASNYTGHFIVTIDNFLQRMNSPAGFDKWSIEIGHLIGMFRDWEALIVIATKDIADFFKLGAGLGTGIVLSLTQALEALNRWETSVQGSSQLHAIFAAHLNEVLDALKLIYGIIPGIAEVYLHLAVPLTQVADAFIRFADLILNTPIIGQLVAYGVAIGFIAGKLSLLAFARAIGDIPILGGLIAKLIGWLGTLALGWLGVSSAASTAAASQTAAAVTGAASSTAATGGAGLTGGGLLGLLSGGATTGPEFAAAFAGFGAAAAAAAGLGGLIFGTGVAIEALTGDINNIGGQFAGLANPVSQLVSHLDVSSQAASTIRNALTSSSPQMVLGLSEMTQSVWFSHLSAYQQQSVMQDLAAAMQKGLVTTPNDVATFGQAWRDAESKSALTVPLVTDVYNTFAADSAALKAALTHIVANFQSVDHTSTATTVPAAQDIANAFQQTVPISQQIQSILKYTQQGASNTGSSVWKAYSGADALSNALWGSTGPASTISPAASSLATQLWAASGAASALRGLIAGDFGAIQGTIVGPGSGAVVPAPSGAGSSVPNHIYDSGGILTEPVSGIGLRSGMTYLLAGNGNEAVVPLTGRGASGGGVSGNALSLGGGTKTVTVTSNPVFNITGLPSQIADQVKAIVQDYNQQLATAIGA